MNKSGSSPRVLIVTPEVTYLPDRMGGLASYYTAKAGGLADVSAALVKALFDQGADVHVALPDYRSIFREGLSPVLQKELSAIHKVMPDDRVHLAQDRAFYYINHVYSSYGGDNIKLAMAFQREVINNIIPWVQPDLIHCNDWMTGLIPALSRQAEIPCLFTIHNIHTVKAFLVELEDRGIDAAYFWSHLYYMNMATEYESTRQTNPVDFLASGIFAAHFVNTVSPTFLTEIVEGRHGFVEPPLQQELTNKWAADCAVGILNAPDPGFNPREDPYIFQTYGPDDHVPGKKENKLELQITLGLMPDENAPVFFWPSRLDPNQKGCQLLADILYGMISTWWDQNLQVLFVANGEYHDHFRNIVRHHGFYDRVAMCDFGESMEHKGYAAADFILMPSLFEPCGLPQMIACIYGALPVVHDTGGLHDTVRHMDVDKESGNGFVFENYDSTGFFWAVEQAMNFHGLPEEAKAHQVRRVMNHALDTFNYDVTAQQYIGLYEKMLARPLVVPPLYS
jgi:starch synthase